MPTYVEISVNVPQISGVFHYHLPLELEGQVHCGHLVEIPFGKQSVQGVVLREIETPEVAETRAVTGLIDPLPVLTAAQITLAGELSASTLSPLSTCIDLMLPPGLAQRADTLYRLNPQPESAAAPLSGRRYYELTELQNRLINLLQKRGPLRGGQIDHFFKTLDWKPSAKGLIRRGYLINQSILPPPSVRPKNIRTASLRLIPEQIDEHLSSLGRAGTPAYQRRQAALKYLVSEIGPVDVAWVYAGSGCTAADLKYLAERDLITLGEAEILRDPLADIDALPVEPPELTRDQHAALDEICTGIEAAAQGGNPQPFLLFGVTGSGKTEVYLRAAAETIRLGKQVIILVPEISLTPQTVRRFLSRFPGQVGLLHSRLSDGERYDTWRRVRSGQIKVIVGPRSALFVPCPNLGLIVVDEAHDDSYYQSEGQPYYHAREAAVTYARLASAAVVLGTATPDLVTRYRANREEWKIINLPARILAHKQVIAAQAARLGITSTYRELESQAETIDLPPVQVVDMREELKDGNRSIFSRQLQDSLRHILEHNQQAILFLNRRGTATYVFCRDCGYTVRCPRCDLPLTMHTLPSDKRLVNVEAAALRCHTCGYERKLPRRCPSCAGDRIRQYGTGTESVEKLVHELFPGARTLRWDWETTRQKGAHEMILSHFSNGHADVLIGTQMIAKGLDLPLVTLVGMVLADVGLNLPDFRSPERTFQLLTQVAGRAGRSLLGGKVILQTFQPENYVIQAASHHDYQGFYERELEYRKKMGYPPFSRFVRLEYAHHQMEPAEASARALAVKLAGWIEAEDRRATEIIGPAPCFYARIAGRYRWQIILRGPNPVTLLKGKPLGDWRVEVDPVSLL